MKKVSFDTIVAIATPPGYGGIGIIRISGDNALTLLLQHTTRQKYTPWKLHRTILHDGSGGRLDDILAVYMPAPCTFTGEDVVELHCHGSPLILHKVIEALLHSGARSAERGEFSKRALLNNRIDISQAEAIMEIIHAPDTAALSFAQKRLDGALGEYVSRVEASLAEVRMDLYIALDFPEEDLDSIDLQKIDTQLGKAQEALESLLRQYQQNTIWQEGATVVLAGSVNAGKSSLFNAILGNTRAIVSDIEGTTRDYVTERISLHGMPITLIDTAGLRYTEDAIEKKGIDSMLSHASQAECILFVIDATRESLTSEEIHFIEKHHERIIVVYNKIDQRTGNLLSEDILEKLPSVQSSTLTLTGIEACINAIYTKLLGSTSSVSDHNSIVPNRRQYETLLRAYNDLASLRLDIASGRPLDAISATLEYILQSLQEITGYRLPEDILNTIFASFCIGK